MKKTEWEKILRDAIRESGLSLCGIARQTGITDAQLSRFMRGERGLTFTTAEKVAKVVGLELKKKG